MAVHGLYSYLNARRENVFFWFGGGGGGGGVGRFGVVLVFRLN